MKALGRYLRQHHLALIALFVALSGTAYAAATIGSGDIERNAVRSKHIKRGNVRGSDLANGAVSARKLAAGVSLTRGFSFRTSADRTVNNLVSARGLAIDVNCTGTTVTATARPSVANSTIYTASMGAGTPAVTNSNNDSDFDPGSPVSLLGDNDDLQVGHTSYAAGTAGPVVDVVWSADDDANVDCAFVGHVLIG